MSKKKEKNNDVNPYEIDKLSKIPSWLIIFLLKYWAAAAAVFFMTIGGLDVGIDFSQDLNIIQSVNFSEQIILLIGLALAVLNNYAVKQIVILLNNRRNPTFKYNLINQTGLIGFFLNLFYNIVVSYILFFIVILAGYYKIIPNLFGMTNSGIEPFSYALFYIIIDGIVLICKNLIFKLAERIQYKRQINYNV